MIDNESVAGKNLIFLISQPRAGSTLLQRILGGHQDIHTVAEPWLMLHPLYALKAKGIETEYDSNLARNGLDDFLLNVPEGLDLYYEAVREMATVLYDRKLALSGKSYFLDKTPRYYLIISELYRTFPKAKFIILLRNPMAVLSSTLDTWFGNKIDILKKSLNYKDLIEGPRYLIEGIEHLKEDAIVAHYEDLVVDPEQTVLRICGKLEYAELRFEPRP